MKTITIIFIAIIGLVFSCSNKTEKIEYSFNDFSITVPSYMKSVKGRNIDVIAEFIVDSTKNSEYNIDITIYKDDFICINNEKLSLKQYYKFIADDILNNTLESGSLSAVEDINIFGNNAMIFEITGKYKTEDFSDDYYFVSAVIETTDNYYEITIWTPLKFKEELSPAMKDVIFSFN